MERKGSPSCKEHSTSRFFRGVADPKFLDTDRDRDTETVTARPSKLCGSNVVLGKHPDNAPKSSPISETAAGQQNIQQVSEVRQISTTIVTQGY